MILSEFPQVQSLSTRQKLELVDDILRSVTPEVAAWEVTQEERDLLDQRWSEHLHDPSAALTLEQFRQGLGTFRR